MSFSEISNKYNIPKTHFFKYLQIRNVISSSQYYSLDIPITSSLETAILGNCYGKGLLSSLYNLLISRSDESSKHKLRLWMEDIGDAI